MYSLVQVRLLHLCCCSYTPGILFMPLCCWFSFCFLANCVYLSPLKNKICRSNLAHYLFLKMQLYQNIGMHIPFYILYDYFCNTYPMAHKTTTTTKNMYYTAIYTESLLTSILLVDRSLKERVILYSFNFSPVQLKKINECLKLLCIGRYSRYL